MDQETPERRNSRIAKNTLLLYARMLITMGVSLYTVRIVLKTLGVDDYGLYQVISGVVALLGFLPGSMASATQRDFSHTLGQRDQDKLNRIFGVNTLLYLGIGLAALIVLIGFGSWFIGNHVRVSADRFDAAVTVYYLAAFTFAVTIIKSPLMAIIIAHEDMKIYAYMAIADASLKLISVFLLAHAPNDKIITYGALLLVVSVIDTLAHGLICFHKYAECRFSHIRWNGRLARDIAGFTGWTLFGQLTSVARTAAVTVLMNQYFPVAVIAARAIAINIATQTNLLAANFNTSLYPPIIKAYAAGNREEMYTLVVNGSKATFFLMWLPALPLYLEMENILAVWLDHPPALAVDFARLGLIEGLIFAISLPLTTAARAPGQMALYESVLGTLQLGILFASWAFLRAGFGPHIVFYAAIAISALMFGARLAIVGHLTGMPTQRFLRRVTPPVFIVAAVTTAAAAPIAQYRPNGTGYMIASVFATILITTLAIFQLGLPAKTKNKLLAQASGKLRNWTSIR